MKKLVYLSVFLGALVFTTPSMAQISIQINIGTQPKWGPSGYDYARYYYMPEFDMYYDVMNSHYVWYEGNRWISRAHLPYHYRNVNLYHAYKVVINDMDPWRYHHQHRVRYNNPQYVKNHHQVNIRDSYNNRNDNYVVSTTRNRESNVRSRSSNERINSRNDVTNSIRSNNSSRR